MISKMTRYFKLVIRMSLPPIILTSYYKLSKRDGSKTFKGIYKNFDDIPEIDISNYDSEQSLINIRNKTFQTFNNKSEFPKADDRSQITNLLPLTISLFKKKEVSILDFGGGAGETFADCANKINMSGVKFYIYDLNETMNIGKELFSSFEFKQDSFINFVDDISKIVTIDIVYFGSCLQYFPKYKDVIESILCKKPKYVFLTDNFFSMGESYATLQVNMKDRKIAYQILSIDETLSILTKNNYNLIYKSANFQPYHTPSSSDQFNDSLNLLFKKN